MGLDLDTEGPVTNFITVPIYEFAHIWAEESGGTNPNTAEWSFGNGATGYMGLRWDNTEDWEVVGMSFMADTYPSTATIQVDLINYATAGPALANTLAAINLASATDGGGVINNAHKWQDIDPPVPVPAGAVLGFITRGETGNISDARVMTRLRRKIGDTLVIAPSAVPSFVIPATAQVFNTKVDLDNPAFDNAYFDAGTNNWTVAQLVAGLNANAANAPAPYTTTVWGLNTAGDGVVVVSGPVPASLDLVSVPVSIPLA